MKKTKIQGNICVFGDSIVWGAWDKEKAGWVNRLAIYCQNKNNEDIIGSGERKIYTFQSSGLQSESLCRRSGGGDRGVHDQSAEG